MKHLKFFSTASAFEAEKPNIPTPYVAFVKEGNVVYCQKKIVVNPTIVLDIPTTIHDRIPLGGGFLYTVMTNLTQLMEVFSSDHTKIVKT